jgi:poly(3-hydroxybutyrate) depolymerase
MRHFIAILIIALASPVIALERSFGNPEMKLVKEFEKGTRKVLRYECDSVQEWGYAKPQSDYFYLLPLQGNPEGKPLHVVLHSAGHNGDKVLADAFLHPDWFHYSGQEDQIILYFDGMKNRSDYWWGWFGMTNNLEKLKTTYSPTEKRLLTTIEWAIKTYKVDRNRVYLSGISMGGSGSLGIGLCRGDIFAAINVAVPAGVNHVRFRAFGNTIPDPPVLVNFSAYNDKWSIGQQELVEECRKQRYPLIFAFGANGHDSPVAKYHPAAVAFPWRSIRRDEAYPVFTNASTDEGKWVEFVRKPKGAPVDPKPKSKADEGRPGQINAFFRWKAKTDTADQFQMELRMVSREELKISDNEKNKITIPTEATAEVSLRRLQNFKPGQRACSWQLKRGDTTVKTGKGVVDSNGVLVLGELPLSKEPAILTLSR